MSSLTGWAVAPNGLISSRLRMCAGVAMVWWQMAWTNAAVMGRGGRGCRPTACAVRAGVGCPALAAKGPVCPVGSAVRGWLSGVPVCAVMAEQVAGLAVECLAEPGQGAEPDRPGVAVLQNGQVDQ